MHQINSRACEVPCRRGCCQRQRRCRTGLCCRWTCQGSWWTRCPRRTSWGRGPSVTTWSWSASLSPRRSSWCPGLSRLKGRAEREAGVTCCCLCRPSAQNTAAWTQKAVDSKDCFPPGAASPMVDTAADHVADLPAAGDKCWAAANQNHMPALFCSHMLICNISQPFHLGPVRPNITPFARRYGLVCWTSFCLVAPHTCLSSWKCPVNKTRAPSLASAVRPAIVLRDQRRGCDQRSNTWTSGRFGAKILVWFVDFFKIKILTN